LQVSPVRQEPRLFRSANLRMILPHQRRRGGIRLNLLQVFAPRNHARRRIMLKAPC
jgi:hypothetical protein